MYLDLDSDMEWSYWRRRILQIGHYVTSCSFVDYFLRAERERRTYEAVVLL